VGGVRVLGRGRDSAEGKDFEGGQEFAERLGLGGQLRYCGGGGGEGGRGGASDWGGLRLGGGQPLTNP
jgi:hypothetical protein